MLQTLAISRRGLIEIGHVRDDRNQCMNRGDRELDYSAEVLTDPDALDGQGFIIDRHRIHEYFQRKYGRDVAVLPSCEVMARDGCLDLAALVGEKCQKVVCIVGGAVAIWRRPPKQ